MILIDTDVLTLLYYKNAAATAWRSSIAPGTVVVPTIVSRIELLRGRFDSLVKADTAERITDAQLRIDEVEVYLSRFERVIPMTPVAARLYFQLRETPKLRRTGRNDLMNAAIAIMLGATLVTRNVRDYRDVPNLKFVTW